MSYENQGKKVVIFFKINLYKFVNIQERLYICINNNNKIFIFSSLNLGIMYMQLFITQRSTGKLSQFSCDNMEEVAEVCFTKKPKFCKIEYYDCSGLVGTAWKYYNFLQDRYITYKKVKA